MESLKIEQQFSIVSIASNQLFGEGLTSLLKELDVDITFIPYPSDSINWTKIITEHEPDILMMEVYQQKDTWATDLEAFTSAFPSVKVIIYSMIDEKELILEVFKHGAVGYLSKRTEKKMLLEALRAVNQGYYYICPWFTSTILEEFRQLHARFQQTHLYSISFATPPTNLLTKREIELIPLIAQGMSNKKIAETVGLSEKTVKNHISRILSKLELRDRTQVAVTAIKSGWVKL